MKRFLSTTIILLFMLFAHAQPLSDLVKMRELTNLYEKGNSIVPTLKKKGYKHKGWIHAEGLNDFYGADYYYKNCQLNRKGKPIHFDKGNSSIIQIASVGFGPCIVIEVFNVNAYCFYIKQIKAMGFQQNSSDESAITYVRRKTAIDSYRVRKYGSLCVCHNL